MKKALAASAISLLLTGCATSNTLLDGLLGRYHNYDPVEYAHTVQVVLQARELEQQCADPEQLKSQLQSIQTTLTMQRTYTEGRPYNDRITQLTDELIKMVRNTADKEEMSEFFCRQRAKNIVKAAEHPSRRYGSRQRWRFGDANDWQRLR